MKIGKIESNKNLYTLKNTSEEKEGLFSLDNALRRRVQGNSEEKNLFNQLCKKKKNHESLKCFSPGRFNLTSSETFRTATSQNLPRQWFSFEVANEWQQDSAA